MYAANAEIRNAIDPPRFADTIHQDTSRGRHANHPWQTSIHASQLATMNAIEPSMSGRQIILCACSASSAERVAANVLRLNHSVPSDWIPHAQKSIRSGCQANSRNAIRSVPPGSAGALIACTNCR